MIIRYRDDPDLQNAIDGIQKGLKCCGGFSYHDWELNEHFNCSANTVQACGVPFSCCREVSNGIFPENNFSRKIFYHIHNELHFGWSGFDCKPRVLFLGN